MVEVKNVTILWFLYGTFWKMELNPHDVFLNSFFCELNLKVFKSVYRLNINDFRIIPTQKNISH